jgi:prephenate dehydratase
MIKIGCLGMGTYSEKAAQELARIKGLTNVKLIPFSTFEEGLKLLRKNKIDKAIFPIANSSNGPIVDVLKLLTKMPRGFRIENEIITLIDHYLLTIGKESDIKKICSKKEIFGQCRKYCKKKKIATDAVESSAKAAEIVSQLNDKSIAAIGPKWLIEKFSNLKAIKKVSDEENNATRFIMIGKEVSDFTGNDKTSFIFATPNEPGAMDKVTLTLWILGINKTKIESRPHSNKPWEYIFYVDIDGHRKEKRVKAAFEVIRLVTSFLKILGSYPKAK